MKIYTSYFAVARKLPAEIVQISIALHPPKGYKGAKYTKLAPTEAIMRRYKAGGGTDEYRSLYNRDVLSKRNADDLVANLEQYFGGRDVCFLCYEKPGDFCHRHIVAEWLEQSGYDVTEWKPEVKDQFSLFDDLGKEQEK